jgi:nitrate reductase cytochrome c-type subunit
MKKITLLTKEFGNPKLAKSSIDSDYVVTGLTLAPYNTSGYNVCQSASAGCAYACLNTAGNGKYKRVQRARIARTKFFYENRQEFKNQLIEELHYFCGRCFKNG